MYTEYTWNEINRDIAKSLHLKSMKICHHKNRLTSLDGEIVIKLSGVENTIPALDNITVVTASYFSTVDGEWKFEMTDAWGVSYPIKSGIDRSGILTMHDLVALMFGIKCLFSRPGTQDCSVYHFNIMECINDFQYPSATLRETISTVESAEKYINFNVLSSCLFVISKLIQHNSGGLHNQVAVFPEYIVETIMKIVERYTESKTRGTMVQELGTSIPSSAIANSIESLMKRDHTDTTIHHLLFKCKSRVGGIYDKLGFSPIEMAEVLQTDWYMKTPSVTLATFYALWVNVQDRRNKKLNDEIARTN